MYVIDYRPHVNFYELHSWLIVNCTGQYVIGQGFEKWVSFAKEQDASAFALKWG